ncbi:MAG: SDR family oxidoreductase [Dehalococcoidales bacterium]|nr:SDR family oxidoreductase [Dehalococcoidales bacterium]
MDLGLKGKVALVTGAGSRIGFGRAISLTLAKEGCDIIVNDIDSASADETVKMVKELGCKAVSITADITRGDEVRSMVDKANGEFGKIDILVNNAGGCTPPKPFMDMTKKEWEFDINVNLMGVLYCTRAVLPGMIERKYGKVISLISGAGINGGAMTAVYSAAKGGIYSFSMAIAKEMGPHGINVNCVSPGPAITGFARNAPPGMLEEFGKSIPIGRLTEQQDVANAVTFLASDVSADIVGQAILVTGNVSA